MEIAGIKMTREEHLAYMLKHNFSAHVLGSYEVRYLIRTSGKSLAFVGRYTLSKDGRREFRKWMLLYALRDLMLAAPALIVLYLVLILTLVNNENSI